MIGSFDVKSVQVADQSKEPTSPNASRQVVNSAVKMTLPLVNAPAEVNGRLM